MDRLPIYHQSAAESVPRRHSIRSKSGIALFLFVSSAGISGCSFYPDKPLDGWNKSYDGTKAPAVAPNPQGTFESAIQYAQTSQNTYRDWLVSEEEVNLAVGGGALALGGAAIGLATAGGSTTAVTALTVAGGTAVAADQFFLGSPKDAKSQAYLNGINELQCVIGDALAEKPQSQPFSGAPKSAAQIGSDLLAANSALKDDVGQLDSTIINLGPECEGDQTLRAARLSLARARAVSARATDIAKTLSNAPQGIVFAVNAIDTAAFTQSQASLPDVGSIKITPLPSTVAKASGTPASSAPSQNRAATLEWLNRPIGTKPRLMCGTQLQPSVANLAASTSSVQTMISGVMPASTNFSECIKAPPSPSTSGGPSNTGASDTAGKQQASALAVLPGLQLVAAPQQLIIFQISGGRAPYYSTPVDPGLFLPQSGVVTPSVIVEPWAKPGQILRVLVTDSLGAELVVSVQVVQIAPFVE